MIDANGLPSNLAPSQGSIGVVQPPSSGLASTATVAQPPSPSTPNTASGGGSSKSPRKRPSPLQVGLGIAALAVVFVGGVVATRLVGQNQDIRQQAQQIGSAACAPGQTGISCPGGTCPDGWAYGPDSCAPHATCEQRHAEACQGHGGGGETQPTPPPGGGGTTCSNAAPTASACRGNQVGSQCTGFAGTCIQNGTGPNGEVLCGCQPTSTCLGANGVCTQGSSSSACANGYANGGAGCAIGFVCCSSGRTNPPLKCNYNGAQFDQGQRLCVSSTTYLRCDLVNAGQSVTMTGPHSCPSGQSCSNGVCVPGTGGGATPAPTPGTGGPNLGMCTNPGQTSTPAVSFIKFTCPQGCFNADEGDGAGGQWRCYSNRVDSTDPNISLNGECGQIDILSGTGDQNYCGTKEYTCGDPRCHGTASPPPSTPPFSPPPSTPPASTPPLACLNITVLNKTTNTPVTTTAPQLGQVLQLTCGQVTGAASYVFRVVEGDGTIVNLQASTAGGRISQDYTVRKTGRLTAQCQVCSGPSGTSCAAFAPVN